MRFNNKGGYCDRVQSVLLVSVVFSLPVLAARSQDEPSVGNHAQNQFQLPAGAGKQIMERACGLCHRVSIVANEEWTPKDWPGVISRMVELGAPLRKEEIPVVIDYLDRNFTDARHPPGVVVPGGVEATIKEWDNLPTPNSRPHDTIYTREGFVWYTGEFANLLGQFDPKTQHFKEYPLKRPHSVPHGLAEDKQGNIWFTALGTAYIGKLDPKTGDITEYPLPDPTLYLHSLAIDPKGMVFFTVMAAMPPWHPDGSKIGRLNPKTGEMKLVNTPTPNSNPYTVVINSKGIPFFTERGSPRLGSINPDTMDVTEYVLPNPEIGTRHLALTPDDVVWYTDSARGYLGRFDPTTGEFREWPSPSGPKSLPYGTCTVGNIIWFVEARSKPNMLVRFDPNTEKFETWPIKSGGAVKTISPQPDGNLWFARPGSNGIAYVQITAN
jgi:virginiamycin B lyase